MRSVLAGTVAALTSVVVALATASRDQDQSGHSSAGPATASSSSSPGPAPSVSPATPEERRSPQRAAPLPRSEPASSSDAGNAPAAVPTAGNTSPSGNAPPSGDTPPSGNPAPSGNTQRSDEQLAALQELVAQSRLQNEQLWYIDEQLASVRRQAADAEFRRVAEKEQEAAQHAATLQALDVLRRAEALLAVGDYEGVEAELGRAEAALPGRTRVDVDAAREALGRSDLYAARVYLAAALAERRPLR
jgi:hypothetical protein